MYECEEFSANEMVLLLVGVNYRLQIVTKRTKTRRMIAEVFDAMIHNTMINMHYRANQKFIRCECR
jgi:hypothetical protein